MKMLMPCKDCLKYVMCNNKLRSELSCYTNPSNVSNVSIVTVTSLILKCKDLENYIDYKIAEIKELDPDKQFTKEKSNFLDIVIYNTIRDVYNLENLDGEKDD